MHQALVFDGNWYDHVLEGVLMVPLHCENTAYVLVVMLPKDSVFRRLEAVENGLHGDDRQRLGLESFCVMVSCLSWPGTTAKEMVCTFLGPLLAALPYLLLRIALAKDRVLLAIHA
jgi:hypothetical protein